MVETSNQNSAVESKPTTEQTEDNKGDSKTFTQDEVNNMIQKRIAEEKTKAEERNKQAVADAIAEYERKAKLTEEQRANEERKAKDDELAEKERSITLRENRADGIEKLAELSIDTKLVDFVVDINKDTMFENIEKLNKSFNEAVSKAVEAKLAGKTPTDFGDGSKNAKKSEGLTETGYHANGAIAF
ncbi:MAG: DUF4355 domain-containing protein [Candidatus Saccharibacteria bacterium]|nr:DUF4355 domain-containing protein [Candidatus Saccharibacteria bacterium]